MELESQSKRLPKRINYHRIIDWLERNGFTVETRPRYKNGALPITAVKNGKRYRNWWWSFFDGPYLCASHSRLILQLFDDGYDVSELFTEDIVQTLFQRIT